MAEVFNEQRKLGIVMVDDGTAMFNGLPVIGVAEQDEGVLFAGNLRTLGVEVVDEGTAIWNDQPVRGAVLITDGRTLYNGTAVVPTTGAAVLGEELPYLPTQYTLLDHDFAVLPDTDRQPYNATLTTPAGQTGDDWIRLEARTGDNNGSETGLLRVGLDGYPHAPLMRLVSTAFDVIPGDNTMPASDDWWDYFEVHAKRDPSHPSEYEGSGPLACFIQQSGGNIVLRTYVKYAEEAALTGSGDITQTQYTTTLAGLGYDLGDVLNFEIALQRSSGTDSDGSVTISVGVNGGAKTEIVNYEGRVGYGDNRDLYLQYRLYASERDGPMVAWYRITEITDTGVPWTPEDLGAALVYHGNTQAEIEALSASDGTQGFFVALQIADTATNRTILGSSANGGRQWVINTSEAQVVNRQGAAVHAAGVGAVPTGTPAIVGMVLKSTTSKPRVYLNGVLSDADRIPNAALTSALTTILGAKAGGTEPFSGSILSNYVITTGAVSDADMERIGAYLAWENGYEAALAGTTYADAPPSV